MSRHTKTLRMGDGNSAAARERTVVIPDGSPVAADDAGADASTPAKEIVETAASTSSDEASVARITARTLERYLAMVEADREAAEERSAKTIARFTKLTAAMVAMTLVVAGVNVVMILRQPKVSQPAALLAPPAAVPPAVIVAPAAPVPPPPLPDRPVQAEPAPAAPAAVPERIHLLGKPRDQALARASAPAQPRLARATIKPNPVGPLPTARAQIIGLEEVDRAERW